MGTSIGNTSNNYYSPAPTFNPTSSTTFNPMPFQHTSMFNSASTSYDPFAHNIYYSNHMLMPDRVNKNIRNNDVTYKACRYCDHIRSNSCSNVNCRENRMK